MTIDRVTFDGRTALVTGAGRGLGRSHALGLAARGARVVVNDLGRAGEPPEASRAVVAEIEAAGGTALADGADISEPGQVEAMVARAERAFGGIDILVNNAGILRDRSFGKMPFSEFELVLRVHLVGAALCAKAVWEGMRQRRYGRILFTTSGSGLYGNFGQANYGAAKAGLIGLMNVLHLEGAKYDIRVNALAPMAATGMTEGLLPPGSETTLTPEAVTPAVLFLVSRDAPSRLIMAAGAGAYAITRIQETSGLFLPPDLRTPEAIAARLAEISDAVGAATPNSAFEQVSKFIRMTSGG